MAFFWLPLAGLAGYRRWVNFAMRFPQLARLRNPSDGPSHDGPNRL